MNKQSTKRVDLNRSPFFNDPFRQIANPHVLGINIAGAMKTYSCVPLI